VSPDFRELIGDDVAPEERERLRRAHDLLVAAGPPPDLPASLREAPKPRRWTPRIALGRWLLVPAAAALAAAAFAGGYFTRDTDDAFDAVRVVRLAGTSAQPQARGRIEVGARDSSGNWPMIVRVSGLPRTTAKGYYEVLLTRNGEVVGPCGSFLVRGETTQVYLTAAYELRKNDGWTVVLHPRGHVENPATVMRTVASA
jgi:hypothetical protein